jgi:hypothetical protein
MSKGNLLSIPELKKKYPNHPFSSNDLGRFLRLHLLEGESNKKYTLIDEKSFLQLVKFRNSVIETKMVPVGV